MKVLVTGGAGFIGSHIVEAGMRRGHELLVLDNLSTGFRKNVPPNVPLLEVDLRDAAATLEAVRRFQPDAICHQAAQASVGLSLERPALDAEINVVGSLNLLEAALSTQVKRFVFASTGGAIYGEIPDGTRASSTTPAAPESPYAVGKLTVENYLRLYERTQGLKTNVLRYANVYGPRQSSAGEAGVVSVFLNRASHGQPLPIFAQVTRGDDGCVRDYVYVEDVARANWLALEGLLTAPLLNLGTGVGTSTRELAEELCERLGHPAKLEFAEHRVGDLRRSVLDPCDALRELGELTSLGHGLDETLRWYRAG